MHQVLNTIKQVKHKRPRKAQLDSTLDQQRPTRKSSRDRGTLQVPTGKRCNQVRNAVAVQTTRKDHASEALEDGGAEPGLVAVVDFEMRRDGAQETLLCEDGLCVEGGHGLCCCVAARGLVEGLRGGGGGGCEEGGGGLGEEGGGLGDYIGNVWSVQIATKYCEDAIVITSQRVHVVMIIDRLAKETGQWHMGESLPRRAAVRPVLEVIILAGWCCLRIASGRLLELEGGRWLTVKCNRRPSSNGPKETPTQTNKR